jgi:DNA polymerase III epsilon subunit-like protein
MMTKQRKKVAREQARAQARQVLALNPVIVDLETTGLRPEESRIIEIAILTQYGGMLLDTLISPELPSFEGDAATPAQGVNRITYDMLRGAPAWTHVLPLVNLALVRFDALCSYNVKFDAGFLRSQGAMLGEENGIQLFCIMECFAQFYGEWNEKYHSWRWQSLGVACECFDIINSMPHRAAGDAEAARQVLVAIAKR